MQIETKEPYIEVIDMTEHDDGSATITFEMDRETTITFAKFGLLQALKDAANKVNEDED
jgi:hypothetical protein